jgi:hypothetical protein
LGTKQWTKIKNLTTSWKTSFADEVDRDWAVKSLVRVLQNARITSKAPKVEYGIQMSKIDVLISMIKKEVKYIESSTIT